MAVTADDLASRLRRAQLISRQSRLRESQSTIRSVEKVAASFGGGFNRGFAQILGMSFDAVNFLLDSAGVPVSDKPLLGSKSINEALTFVSQMASRGIEATGVDLAKTTGRETAAQRFAGRIGEEIGAAVVPAGGIAGAVRAGAAGGLAEPILSLARSKPASFALGETALAATAGTGAQIGLEASEGESPGVQLAAETAGQLIGGLGPSAVVPAVGLAARAGRKLTGPFTTAGTKERAGTFIREIATDPERALRNLENPPDTPEGSVFTTAELADDAGLQNLERSTARSDAKIAGRVADDRTQTNRAARRELEDIATRETPARIATEFIQGRVDTLKELMTRRVSNATRLARQRLDEAGPEISRQDASRVVKKEFDDALEAARKTEKELHGAIDPEGVLTPVKPVRDKIQAQREAQRKADKPENIPTEIEDVLKGFDDAEPTVELLALRSRVLEDIRIERAGTAPNRRLVKNLEEIQETILDMIGVRYDTLEGPIAERASAALTFSRELNDRFTRGPVGEVLGFQRTGAGKVADISTLESLFKAGIPGEVGMTALLRAADGNEGLINATEQFIRGEFIKQTSVGGKVTASAQKRFLKRHAEALDQFPDLKKNLESVEGAQQLAESAAASVKVRQQNILNVGRSRAALFLNSEPDKVVRRLLSSKKPKAIFREVVKQLKKDPTGEAFKGFKTLLIDEAFRKAELLTLDQTGRAFLSSSGLREFRKNKAISEVLSVDELRRFDAVEQAMRIAERSTNVASIGQANIPEISNVLIQSLGRIVGARVGSKIGTTPLISAGIGGRIARAASSVLPDRQISELLKQAIFDPEVMKTLLTKPTQANAAEITRRLRGHLVNLGGESLREDE